MSIEPMTVVHYTPENDWCREGTAIADNDGRLIDTYWQSRGNNALSAAEETSAQVIFHLSDYRELERAEHYRWADYHPSDRQVITSQHGLQRRLFVRKDAEPDLATRIENAREAVREAEQAVRSAERTLEFRSNALAQLIAEGES